MSTTTLSRPITNKTTLRQAIKRHVTCSLGMSTAELAPRDAFRATELAIRDILVERLFATEQQYRETDAKRLYYLSLEFLIGRSLHNNLINLGLLDDCRDILARNRDRSASGR